MLPKQLGKYKIERWVASGAYGDLYEAVDTVIEQRIAVKVINISDSEKRDKASAIQEAKYLLKLHHPNIVRFYNCDLLDNHLLIFMELLEGKSLKTMIKEDHRYIFDQFFRISFKILDAVKYIHDSGIIHCDLNTENILLTKNNEIKIIDFGLATRGRDVHCGTPSYTAPELWEGKPNSIQSDIFSLACIFYEIIECKQAFPGSSIEGIKNSILNKKPAIPKSKVIKIQKIIPVVMKCLERIPGHRTSNCAELLEIMYEQVKILKDREASFVMTPPKLKEFIDDEIATPTHEQRVFKEALIMLKRIEVRDNQRLSADHVITEIANYIKINGKNAFIRNLMQEIRSNKNVITNMLCPKGIHCNRTRREIAEIATEIILESDDYGLELIPRLQSNILTGYQIGRYSAVILSKKYECAESILLPMLDRKNPRILRNVLYGLSELEPNKKIIDSINNIYKEYSKTWYIRDACLHVLGRWRTKYDKSVKLEKGKTAREANILIATDK